MAAASAIALAAAFNSVDPRVHPSARTTTNRTSASSPDSTLPAPDQYEALLGRRLTRTPAHLTSRILYLPSHNDKVTHLPVYDFTTEFTQAVKDEPLGSSRFKTSFGLMPKPVGDGRGASEVSYLVDFEPREARRGSSASAVLGPEPGPYQHHRRKTSLGGVVTKARVQRRMLFGAGAEVGLLIPPPSAPGTVVADGAVACTVTPSSTTTDISVLTSFPVPPTMSKFGSSQNPWFTFTIPSLLDDERTLQWQIHPVEQGMLRYTLVELPLAIGAPLTTSAISATEAKKPPFSACDKDNEHLVRAIYHNVGLGFSLSQPYSEGALLLQNDLDPELEAVIVASLLGVLWKARNEESKPRKNSKPEANGKPARTGSVDEPEGATSPTSGKKRLLGKILGKK